MPYKDTLADRTSIVIDDIEEDEDNVTVPNSIDFTPRDNPDIDVNTSGRFTTHEIIGGDVVRQKLGEDVIEITVRGVCDEGTAQQIDRLRNARHGTLLSERIEIQVQFASMSTQPTEEGGAVDMDTGEYLYDYTLNLVGVE